jgi:HEAT repeat protein
MAKSDPVADALAKLKSLDPSSPEATAELAKALQSKSNLVSARAATIIHDNILTAFADELVKAFDRFMAQPMKLDKGCHALTAIAKALFELNADADATFLRGIRHVQPEPIWGGSQDTAAEMRGYCALGLVRSNHRDVLNELADLLMDPEPTARHMAARAIGYNQDPAGAPLLRLKILTGDANYDVTTECLSSLVKLTPAKCVEFIGRLLEHHDADLREAAILALGESRQPAAWELLRERYDREILADARKVLLLAMAMTRHAAAVDFLIATIAAADKFLATTAIEAMRIYRNDVGIRTRVEKAVRKDLKAEFAKHFS